MENLTTFNDDTRYANEFALNIKITVEMETNIDTTISQYRYIIYYAIRSNVIVRIKLIHSPMLIL